MTELTYLFIGIIGVFNIILMFKLWGACNNIAILKEYFVKNMETVINEINVKELDGFKTNEIVNVKGSNNKVKIIDIEGNKLVCSQNGLRSNALYFSSNEVNHI